MNDPKKPDAAPTETPTAPRWLLKLNVDGVYMGARRLPPDETPAAGAVVLDHQPDNPPGKYRWNADKACLEALPKVSRLPAAVPMDVSAMRALRLLIVHLRKKGEGLPVECYDWADAYGETVDGH